jgi:hypothetical protein
MTTLAAWRLGRTLHPPGRSWSWLYGLLCGIAGAASAAVLDHTWLKQYTAEAFVAVAVAVLLAQVERAWSWRSLAAYTIAGIAGFLVSNTAPLVSTAGLAGLWLTTLLARRWSRLLPLAATTVALGLADVIVYRAQVVWRRFGAVLCGLGWGPWWLALALIVVGVLTLWRAGLPALALTPPVIGAELLALGLAGSYPFLEPRTSVFYAALLTVAAATGLATLARLALASRATVPLAVVGMTVLGLLLVPGWVRAGRGDIPGDDVSGQVADVLAHRQPGDAVVVGFAASFSFAYYWPDRPTFVPTTANTAVTFMPTFPEHPDLVLVHRPRSARALVEAFDLGMRLGRQRAWVITGSRDELVALQRRAKGVRLISTSGSAILALAADGRSIGAGTLRYGAIPAPRTRWQFGAAARNPSPEAR